MAQRVTMKPKEVTPAMLRLIAAQAEGTETFQLPGNVTRAVALLALDAMEKPEAVPAQPLALESPLKAAARQMVAFLTPGQRQALRLALRELE